MPSVLISIRLQFIRLALRLLGPVRLPLLTSSDPLVVEPSPTSRRLLQLERLLPNFEKLPLPWARFQLHLSSHLLMRPAAAHVKITKSSLQIPNRRLNFVLFEPSGLSDDAPLILYFHGGGWVLGRHHSFDRELSQMAARCACRVASFDYRLAPEHPYPKALQDLDAAYQAAIQNKLVSYNRIVLAGDSAGANLVACYMNQIKETKLPMPAAQVLIYPVTDLQMDSDSYQRFAEGFLLTRQLMQWFRQHYLSATRLDLKDPNLSPLYAHDFSNSPPSLIVTAGYDILRDEGIAYACRLEEASAPVIHCHYPDLLHGFLGMTGVLTEAAQACDDFYLRLRKLLDN